jgi:putative tricarboxylic transport membrane protein
LISLILGFFAISEMLNQMIAIYRKRSSAIADGESKIESLGEETVLGTIKVMMHSKWLLVKSSLMGMFIGVLPGPGGAISAFVAYGEAKRAYKHEQFGVGNPRGIIAAESANNGAVGGSLVPMLALGIPGSPTAAIMYGALIIHGLVAGPRLFTDHAHFAYTFIYGMLITIIVMGMVGILCVPLFSKILTIDMRYIIPVVVMCSLVGAFSMRNSMFDVYATLVFGVIGCLFGRFGIPTSPVVLGLILGSLVESNFRLSVTLASAHNQNVVRYILSRPLSLFIVLIGLFLIYANFKTMLLESKATKK